MSAVVIGAGPGIGRAVAVRFARAGLPVAVLARGEATVAETAAAVAALGVATAGFPVDAADEHALRDALDRAAARLGPPEVLIYNAALIRRDRPGELSVAEHQAAHAVNVVGALTAAAHVAPGMAARGSGTILMTGGMPRAKPAYTSLSVGKAGLRAVVELLDAEYGPAGVHVATVTVAGTVAPGTPFAPDLVAERFWEVHTQPRPRWQRETVITGLPLPTIQ
jgi:NAD(P)-dependent dehydrogenase (short-subunit alcohol dehydrogenase family)